MKKEDVQYKILVTEGLEEKIRTSCKLFKDKEWSGVLFYSVEGSFKENNISIKALDYFPMDIGSASYTEYDQSPEIVGYMVDNPELLGAKMGLIHSHNKMSTFFSGTDLNTLQEEGYHRNHFVSLIVNNEGEYTAAITRKINNVIIQKVISKYETFDNEEIEIVETDSSEEVEIVYNILKVTIENSNINKEDPLVIRYKEIAEEKLKKAEEARKKSVVPYTGYNRGYNAYGSYNSNYGKHINSYSNSNSNQVPPSSYKSNNKSSVTQQDLFEDSYYDSYYDDVSLNTTTTIDLDFETSDEEVKEIAAKLVTANPVYVLKKDFNLDNYIKEDMKGKLDKLFKSSKGNYEDLIAYLVEYLLFIELDNGNYADLDYKSSILAQRVWEYLDKFNNPYVKTICNSLLKYF